jgi:hypothetical protein
MQRARSSLHFSGEVRHLKKSLLQAAWQAGVGGGARRGLEADVE